ncbi:MAG: hypothetical protein IKE70_02615 [Bacilli bacterium]|nr:hypothetical protein [Bacilli bacterium]
MLNYDDDLVKNVLKERKSEVELKKYFKKMNDCFGEDYCSLVFSSSKRPSDSLQLFTDKFPNLSDTEIVLLLIRGAIVSDENNYQNLMIQDFVENGEMVDLMNYVYSNLSIRKMLTRSFIHNSYGKDIELFMKKKDIGNTLGNLLTIQYFQENIPTYQKKKM